MMPNALEMLVSQYGVHKLGAMAVQINADFRGPALARMINLTESRCSSCTSRWSPPSTI